jgi:sugar phosphate permease
MSLQARAVSGSLIPPPLALAWLVWGIGAALYFVSFYQRVAPAVLTQELSSAFTLTAAGLGHLSAFYFYSYVAMQIPTGILADRFGPRLVLTVGAAIAAIGTGVFASAETTTMANSGRLLIGASVGVAFVGMLKLSSHWMPVRHFALATSLSLVIGVTGAVSAGAPLRLLVDAYGWRDVMWASAIITALIAIAAWWIVRDDPVDKGYKSFVANEAHEASTQTIGAWEGLRAVLSYRNVVLLYLLAGSMTGIVLTFAGLWGVPFLTTHYGLTQTAAATLCSVMMIAWAAGCVVFGQVSERMHRRKLPLMIGIAGAAACWAILIYTPNLSRAMLTALLAATGFFAGCFILVFAFAKESVPIRFAGTVSGVANTGVIGGPMFMQPLVGIMLDQSWQGTLVAGKRVFTFSAYSQAFTAMLVWAVLSLVVLAFVRETHCAQARE